MDTIICENDLRTVIDQLQEYLQEGSIQGMRLVDLSDNQIVLLIDDKPIDQATADIWWSGYKAALGC